MKTSSLIHYFPIRRLASAFATGVALILSAFAASAQEQPNPPRRVNIVVIFTDDQTYRAIGYNNPSVKTPHLDSLAASGMTFERAYVASPICAASRASMMTGVFPQQNGLMALDQRDFRRYFPPSDQSRQLLPNRLKKAGYTTAFYGKSHLGEPKDYGFDTGGQLKGHDDVETFKQASAYIKSRKNSRQPFFLWLAPRQPHVPLLPEQQWLDLYPSDSIRLTKNFRTEPSNESLNNQGTPDQTMYRDSGYTRNMDKLPSGPPRDEKTMLAFTRAYYAVVSHLDHQIGSFVDLLRETGLMENTVVIFLSDNGYHLGSHGLGNKITMHEESVRVPMFAFGEGIEPGKTTPALVSALDVYPTVLELAGAPEPPEPVMGKSLLPLFKDPDAAHRTTVFSECVGADGKLGEGHRMARGDRWKLILSDRDEEFLFDQQQDPFELNNRVADPELAPVLDQLRSELSEWMKSIGDRSYPFVSKPDAGEGSAQNPMTIIETPAMPENPPETWLTYHLAHPVPEPALDPNPAFFWKGRYHLHYIYKDRTGFCFAHVSSDDMVHWEWHPTVLGPTTMGHGMFSGTGFITKDGRPAMVYHGKGSERNWISYALDDKLDQWSKPHEMTPRDQDGKLMTDMPYFDPDLWIKDGIYYGVNGVSGKKPAVIMKSDDLKDWDYIGELLHPDFDEEKLGVGRDEDVSCANIFKLGEKWVLLCISHKLGCRYFIGDFKDEQFLPEQHGLMNWSRAEFFAPESLLTPDGRRVMWAWCAPRGARKPISESLQKGIQSLPRELSLSDEGTLLIKPLRELKKLRSEQKTVTDLTVKSDSTHMLEGVSGDTMELELVLEAPSAKEFGIKVLCDQEGNKGFTISSGKGSKTLNVGYIDPTFELQEGEDLTLRIFIDKNMIEVFANDRQAALAWHAYDADDLHVSLFSKGGDLKVKKVSAWQMNSIYK